VSCVYRFVHFVIMIW